MSVEPINARWAQTHGDDRQHYNARFVAINQPRRSFWHWFRGCTGLIQSDRHGLWFQCSVCNRVSGFVPRENLDNYLDWHLGEYANRKEG